MEDESQQPVTRAMWYQGQKTMHDQIKTLNRRLDVITEVERQIIVILKLIKNDIKNHV